ncbi:MAG TPA: TonB-dependent receptor [Opitutaceae bacterium]
MIQTAANALALCAAAQAIGTPRLAAEAAGPGGSAAADEQAIPLETVVVDGQQAGGALSSPKYTEPLLDTPQTIDVIPEKVYRQQGATTLSDVLRDTPGITFFAGEGGSADRTGGDSFYLRGFDTSNSIFIDGVRDEGAAVHDTFDLEQVEVVKGPSSENGRGGTAGYINMVTRMPEAGAFGDVQVSHGFGADGSMAVDRATLDINQPLPGGLVPGTALRLDLMEQGGGVPGREYAENNRWGVAPSLAFGLGTPTQLFLSYEHQYEHNIPDYGLPSTAVAGYAPPAAPGSPSFFSAGVDPATYYGFVDYDYEHVTNDAGEVRFDHAFQSGVRLENQARYDRSSRLVEASAASGSVAVAPAGEASIQQGIYQTLNETFSDEASLTAQFQAGAAAHSLSTGLELGREKAINPTWSTVAAGAPNPAYLVSIYDPLDFPASLPGYVPHRTGAGTGTRIDTAAAYAFDTVKLGRRWEVEGGVRADHYSIGELSVVAPSPAIPAVAASAGTATTPATAAAAAVAAVAPSRSELKSARTAASGKAGLVFKPAPSGSLYVSLDSVTRPPGASSSTNTLSTAATSADDPLLEPEKAVNYEAGVKWSLLGEHLLADMAVFRSVVTNVPAADPVTGEDDQLSNQAVTGVEFGLTGKVTRNWLVYAGYAQMEARVSGEISTNAQGLTLPLLPRESGSLWTTYQVTHDIALGAGVQYMGETERLQATQAPASTTFANQVPSFWLFNAMVSYSVSRRLSLRLNAFNLADHGYVASLNNNGYRLNPGAPRNLLLTAEYRF